MLYTPSHIASAHHQSRKEPSTDLAVSYAPKKTHPPMLHIAPEKGRNEAAARCVISGPVSSQGLAPHTGIDTFE